MYNLYRMFNWLNANTNKQLSKSQRVGKQQRLVDILDQMNLKEDKSKQMVINKLQKLSSIIFDVDDNSQDLDFVNTIMEDLIQSPHKRITKLEIERCNQLWKVYSDSTSIPKDEKAMWIIIDDMLTRKSPTKIGAIKMYRKLIPTTLKEAKEVIDAREQKLKRGW